LEKTRCGSRRHLAEPYIPPTRPGYLLCDTCLEGVENVLVDVPDWYVRRISHAHGRSLRVDVVQVVSDIVRALSSWCAVVVAQRGVSAPQPSVPLLAGFLGVHLQWLTARPTAPGFADDLMLLEQAVQRVVRPDSPLPAPLGPCPWPNCGEQLYATNREAPEDQQIRCAAGHRWPPEEWLALIREQADAARDAADGEGRDVA
jgi:hypothetical protein